MKRIAPIFGYRPIQCSLFSGQVGVICMRVFFVSLLCLFFINCSGIAAKKECGFCESIVKLDSGIMTQSELKQFKSDIEIQAEKNNIDALFTLGYFYSFPRPGYPKNLQKAAEYLDRAATLGDTKSMTALASLYINGEEGIKQDYQKARKYYEMAAEHGDVHSLFDLGLIYENGEGVPADLEKAKAYFEKAAAKGDLEAKRKIASIDPADAEKCKELTLGVEAAEKADFTKAKSIFEKLAGKNCPGALANLGQMYQHGKGVTKNPQKAIEYYKMSAEQGNTTAFVDVGLIYATNENIQNFQLAKEYFEKAVEYDDPTGLFLAAGMYQNGIAGPQDYKKAVSYYERAGALGKLKAFQALGEMYRDGEGVKKDQAKANAYFEKANTQSTGN